MLEDGARLTSVRATALAAVPDEALDRFARMVAKIIRVPVALVSLVDDARQYFPGATGLGQPWAATRQTPLTHSFCQPDVMSAKPLVMSAKPLVITDARGDDRVCNNPAVEDLGVVAYAGMPLLDEQGNILGSLCAIDTAPRIWTDAELDLLADLAAACSAKLRLRITATRAEREAKARVAAQTVAEQLSARLALAFDRSQALLAGSTALANTQTLDGVVAAIGNLLGGTLGGPLDPSYVGLLIRDNEDSINLIGPSQLPPRIAERLPVSLRDPLPAVDAVRTGTPVFLEDRPSIFARYPHLAEEIEAVGWHAIAAAPLPGPGQATGALFFAWPEPHPLEVDEQAVITSLAGYVAHALQRASHLQDRVVAAETLQRAMLSQLPPLDHLELAARYQPAHHRDQVGGDWYDAVKIDKDSLAVVIGDVAGHDINAAARMGQLRSILRGYLVDRHEPPSALLRRLDNANHLLGNHSIASVCLAYVEATPDGSHLLRWSNAGHPPPVLVGPDGSVRALSGRDLLLGASRLIGRTNHQQPLPPGSTLLLYTDGLMERRSETLEEGIARLDSCLAAHAHLPLDELVDAVIAAVPDPAHEDDIAVLALRIPRHPPSPSEADRLATSPPFPEQPADRRAYQRAQRPHHGPAGGDPDQRDGRGDEHQQGWDVVDLVDEG
ncbi:SpoIIE family protein phosphatase [Micromonospora sp. SL4-19]|uniref:SpoIIE family protein phosphatase n=1 Tax=Micromonospora sp. SL4-19 TaxID=3399129 RepID=UPI003A4D9F1C